MDVQSVSEIRAHFPALARQMNGRSVAYFDGPGGTQVPTAVVEAMTDYLYHHNANTHWAYPSSQETDALLAGARQTLAEFLNATPQEIAFGANMTTLTNHLARALGRQMRPGDEIVVTELDHHANIDPWRALTKDCGIVVKQARLIPESGQIDWHHLESLMSGKTRLVAIGAASNALGTINDIPRAVTLAQAAKALVFVDAVHFAPHELCDVQAWQCDFLACSAYKFYGPHVGVLFGRHDLLADLDFPRLEPAPSHAPEIVETGTLNHEGIVGAAAAVDFLASLATGQTRRERLQATFSALSRRGKQQVRQMWAGLSVIEGVRVFGPPPKAARTSTIAFTIAGVPSEVVCRKLADHAIFASNGDFYATTVVNRLGLSQEGLVRAGCACYTTDEEVMRLTAAVAEIAKTG